jgi:4,5-DOPA dioxygenase extradiol
MSGAFPAIFVSHGAPTLAVEPGRAGDFLTALGRDLDRRFGRPSAVLVVSAHWETVSAAVSVAARPGTLHDFGGFPEELFRIRYAAPGAVTEARQAAALLEEAGIAVELDARRGLDHGAWVPLRLMYPEADVPLSQISLQTELGPAHQVRVGEALRPLRGRGVLVLGSGQLTHNLRDLFSRRPGDPEPPYACEFLEWLRARAEAADVEALLDYRRRAPHAARNHPTEEHLLPFFTVLGARSPGGGLRRVHRSNMFGFLSMEVYEAP